MSFQSQTTTFQSHTSRAQGPKHLRENDSIAIPWLTKGTSLWWGNCEDYDGKITTLLADVNTYKRVMRKPTLSQERKMNDLFLTFMQSGAISECLYHRLKSSAGKVRLLYCLPKVNWPDIQLIVSFVNSPMYALSKHRFHIFCIINYRSVCGTERNDGVLL